MENLLQTIEATAARGAAGLTPEARATLGAALRALQTAEGGYAGLDGCADPYYAFFAWLSLRALGAPYERDRLCAYMGAQQRSRRRVDAQCAELLLAMEGCGARPAWLKAAAALWLGDARQAYASFLLMLATGDTPHWVARLAWWRQQSLFGEDAARRLPTPRLAAGQILASLAGAGDTRILRAMESRSCPGGGFASAPGAAPDLLATAVARFAMWRGALDGAARGRGAHATQKDLAFIEACWLEDGLFGASPRAEQGDAEHTFYGLLALGTCRADHS